MSQTAATVVDTDVFSALFLRQSIVDPRAERWRERLIGRPIAISFQTRAEVLSGARIKGWGQRWMNVVVRALEQTPTIHTDDDVVNAYANLTAECQRSGHGLHDKVHTADRWIAACAIAKGFDLLAGDAIYRGAPNLTVRN